MIKMFRAGVKRMATDRQGSEEREGSRSDAIGGRRAGWFASLFRRGTPVSGIPVVEKQGNMFRPRLGDTEWKSVSPKQLLIGVVM